MTTDNVVNGALLTLGGAFIAQAVLLLQHDWLWAVIMAVVGTGVFVIREVLP